MIEPTKPEEISPVLTDIQETAGPTEPPTKSGAKKGLIVGAIVAIIGLALLVSIFVILQVIKNDSSSGGPTPTKEGTALIIDKISAELGVNPAFHDTSAEYLENGHLVDGYYQNFFQMINPTTFTASVPKESWKYADIGTSSADMGVSGTCKTARANDGVQTKLDQALAVFTEAGYTSSMPAEFPSSQSLDCNGGYEVTNQTESCSLTTSIERNWQLAVACVPTAQANAGKARSIEKYQVSVDIFGPHGTTERPALLNGIGDIKDSKLSGYKIVGFNCGMANIYECNYAYKKGSDKWVRPTQHCESWPEGGELKKIFEGEPCTPKTPGGI